jgi:serine/threonine protein kinase
VARISDGESRARRSRAAPAGRRRAQGGAGRDREPAGRREPPALAAPTVVEPPGPARTRCPGLPPTAIGAAIGRYQLLEIAGIGGAGIVLCAWDPELERRVAIKVLQTAGHARESLLREGRLLARCSHPNVVSIFDVGVARAAADRDPGAEGLVYLVTEWIRGATLRAFAAARPGAIAVLRAYLDAGAGLAAAHAVGVVHRDFKPDNAIRGDDGRVRVLDFGLAEAPGAAGAGPARSSGTPRYMAPEQSRGSAATPACDQYAFCASLREALAATGGAPPALSRALARGLDPDPAARFPSLRALLDELGELAAPAAAALAARPPRRAGAHASAPRRAPRARFAYAHPRDR